MPRIRLTIKHNLQHPTEDLRLAARLRSDLWAHSPVEIDPDSRVHGTHRDRGKNAYLEFVTEFPEQVDRVLEEFGYLDSVTKEIIQEEAGEACQNCGNIAGPILPTICPNCRHRDIDSCPNCRVEVPRQEYEKVFGDIFRCPKCKHRVQLQINPELWKSDGTLNEPVVMVQDAEEFVQHGNL